jgi:hypothetical protein
VSSEKKKKIDNKKESTAAAAVPMGRSSIDAMYAQIEELWPEKDENWRDLIFHRVRVL